MGSDYETTGSTEEDPFAFDDDSDLEDEYEEEESEVEDEMDLSEGERNKRKLQRKQKKEEDRLAKEEEERKTRFNPVKYLAQVLKDIKKANKGDKGLSVSEQEPDSPIEIKQEIKIKSIMKQAETKDGVPEIKF